MNFVSEKQKRSYLFRRLKIIYFIYLFTDAMKTAFVQSCLVFVPQVAPSRDGALRENFVTHALSQTSRNRNE